MTEYPMHKKLSVAVKELNWLYRNTPALYEIEDSWEGFEWLAADDADRNFLAYQRKDRTGNMVVVMINFSGADYKNYRLGLPKGSYKVIFNSDSVRYGGTGAMRKQIFHTTKTFSHGKENSITFDLPKLTCVYLIKNN